MSSGADRPGCGVASLNGQVKWSSATLVLLSFNSLLFSLVQWFSNLQEFGESPGRLVETQIAGPQPQVSDLEGLW